jgi:hypothetical protein
VPSRHFVVMATADEIEWPVAVYTREEWASDHCREAYKVAMELALLWGGNLKKIPLGSNPWDEDMYSETEPVWYYYVEVPIGKIEVERLEACELVEPRGHSGQVPEEVGDAVFVEVVSEGAKPCDGVRYCGTQGPWSLLRPEEKCECGYGDGTSSMETVGVLGSGGCCKKGGEAPLFERKVGGDSPCIP